MHPSDLIVCNHVVQLWPHANSRARKNGGRKRFLPPSRAVFSHGNLLIPSIRSAYPVNPLSVQTSDNLCLAHGIFPYP